MTGFLCSTPVYEFQGWRFEFNPYHTGPWPVRKDGELFKRAGDKFFEVFAEWRKLPEEEREKYRISGGCERI